MRAAPALAALLAACAPASDPPRTFRDAAVTLASAAGLDPARLAGRWHEVARLPDGGCEGGVVDYAPRAGGLDLVETCGGAATAGRATPAGPGRLRVARTSGTTAEWVLWLDADARTAVVARPDGTGARILDRSPASSPDRLAAALSVLDFNGFDPAALVPAPPG